MISRIGKEMLASLPGFYEQSRVMASILDAQGLELDKLREAMDGTLNQFFVATATWGLRYWEETVGLPISENESDDVRRRRILAKLRSAAPFSAAVLESIAEAYTQKPVTVTVDAASYLVMFTFQDAFVTDQSFYDQIENLIHAHLGTEFRALFTYSTGLELGFEYRRYVYGIPFAGSFLCGTWPSPTTLGRLYPSSVELSQSEGTNQWPFRFAGHVLTGSDIEAQTINAATQSAFELSDTSSKSSKTYMLCGQIHAGTGVIL